MDLDPQCAAVRRAIQHGFVHAGRAPGVAELASTTGLASAEVRRALGRLAEMHAIVLQPDGDDVRMAMPFSGVPTAFLVAAEEPGDTAGAWWANCAWDALGVAAAMASAGLAPARAPLHVSTLCGDCGAPLTLTIRADAERPEDAVRLEDTESSGGDPVVHFAVPAARWWDDIGFT
jgi:hypothetical protein